MKQRVCISAVRHVSVCVCVYVCRFTYIMPTIVRVYAMHEANSVVCRALEYCCRQFFVLHRIPFVVQVIVWHRTLGVALF